MITKKKLSGAWKAIAALCCMVNALSAAQFGNFTYTDNGTSITITDYPNGAVGAVEIPASIVGMPVTGIGEEAFYSCSGLTSVTIPNSITVIEAYAFEKCTSLASVIIPGSVTSIGSGAFSRCSSLTAITVDALNPVYSSLDGFLHNKDQTTLIACPGGKMGSFTIPASVTSIGDSAFAYCTSLTSVTIPGSVTSIGEAAFYSCSGLTSVTIPNSITVIEAFTFVFCTSLTSITIPGSVTSIGEAAFAYCSGLTSVTIPGSVTSIGDGAFSRCSSLTAITVDALNPVYSSLHGFLHNKDQTTLIACPGGKMGSVTIPASVTSIGEAAFYSCTGLTSVTIPDSVTSIGGQAFDSCTSLTSVTIPSSVTDIGTWSFSGCTSLTNAYFMGDAPSMGWGVPFEYVASGFTQYYFNGKTGFTSPTWNGYPAVSMGDPSAVAPWLLSNGFAYDTDLHADPNGDGVSLLMAYALNLDPKRNLSGDMPRPVIAADQMSLSFYAGSDGVSYTVESSADLQNWSAAGVTLSAADANQFRTATVTITGPGRFLRIAAAY